MSKKESTKFVRLKDKVERMKAMGVPWSSFVLVNEVLVSRGEVSSPPHKRVREDVKFSMPKIIELSDTNVEVVETQVHLGGSILHALSGRQRIGYSALLKSLRKECFELEYDFSEVGHDMEHHDATEASLMQVKLCPKLLFLTFILLIKS